MEAKDEKKFELERVELEKKARKLKYANEQALSEIKKKQHNNWVLKSSYEWTEK